MKIVVNRGRTVRVAVKPGIAAVLDTDAPTRPITETYGPGSLLEIADDEASFLIECGAARKYEPASAPVSATENISQ
jgi:hypothetical protein